MTYAGPEQRGNQYAIDLRRADVVAGRGVINGLVGATWRRVGNWLIADVGPGGVLLRPCQRCRRPAVVVEHANGDGPSIWLCAEHAYEGTWMTGEEFEAKHQDLRSSGASRGVLVAFWNWGHRRVRR